MTQHGARRAGEHRRHPLAFAREQSVSKCVDAAPARDKPPTLEPGANSPRAHSAFEQLPPRDNAMLRLDPRADPVVIRIS
jgi:hypothetical protein